MLHKAKMHTTKEVKQMNPLYQMFNERYIQRQVAVQHHNQQMATAEYCAVMTECFRKHGLIK